MTALLARAEERPVLRPYQHAAIEAIEQRLAGDDRSTLLVLATGLGKTICFAEVVRRRAEAGGRSLILAHRTELLEQARHKLEVLGLDVAIEQGSRRAGGHTAVVASVQTLQRKRLSAWPADHFALIVVDEAHHAAAKSYRNVLEHFGPAKVLGVTATPDRGDGVGLRQLFDSIAYRYEIAKGIDDGWLSPLRGHRVIVDGLDLSAIRTTAGDLNQGDLDLAMRAPEAVHGVAEPLVRLSAGRQTLLFAVTVEHARALADAVNDLAPATAVALDGSASREERARVLDRYHRGELRVLANCALFTEGFDAPATACVAIARPTKSRALYAQMVGRGTRLAAGKPDCLILDFAGVAGRHRLVGAPDALAGDDLDDEERREVEALLEAGEEYVSLALDEGRERVRRRREQRAIAWSELEIDLFGGELPEQMRIEWIGEPMTAGQREELARKGVDLDRRNLDRARAASLLTSLKRRQRLGLCTFRQARQLARHGIATAELSFDAASTLIDGLARNRWRPTPQWLAEARETSAASGEGR